MNAPDLTTGLAEALFRAPWPVMIVTPGKQEIWLNQTFAECLGVKPGSAENLRGLLPDSSWQALMDSGDAELEIIACDGTVRKLARIRSELNIGSLEVHYFSDMSSQQRLMSEIQALREQVRFLETKDMETGLLNRNAIIQALDAQITRSRRYGNSLSVLKLQATPIPQSGSEPVLRRLTESLNSRLRWADQLGRLEEHAFLMILPETHETEARKLADRLMDEHNSIVTGEGWSLCCRIGSWSKGDDVRRLLQRLDDVHP